MNGHATEKETSDTYLLLVDDDTFSRKLALEILRRPGICVEVANNGAEAIEQLGHANYAAVLMDCQMPVMDGFEATRKIRADKRYADLPILAMSGDATEADRQKCLECGMNDCIAKPIDVGQLFNTLARWIKEPRWIQLQAADVAGSTIKLTAHGDAAPNGHGKDVTPDNEIRHARFPLSNFPPHEAPLSNSLPLAGERTNVESNLQFWGERANESLREFHVNVPGLEVDKALRHLDGNVDLLRKLIFRFGETQADSVTRIRAAIACCDADAAAREAHTLKGVAGNIGATQMLECAALVEGMLKHGKTDGLAFALDEMERELHILLERIAVTMKGREPSAGAPPGNFVDMATLTSELREFAVLLANGDSHARKLVDGIAYQLGVVGQSLAADQLKKFVSQYDFNGAMDKLKEAAQVLGIAL